MSDIKINLKPLFKKLEEKVYCIIKLPDEFPEYKIGSDLDVFCYDTEDISKIIMGYLQNFIDNSLTIKLSNMGSQIYIDVMDKNTIHFRFDLYGALPKYENILIKDAFFSSVIENSISVLKDEVNVKVPSTIDENILRYIEYQEWYAQRPDKIKHMNYIEEKIKNSEININNLLDKLHYYTELPEIEDNRQVSSNSFVRYVGYILEMFKKVLIAIQNKGLKETMSLIFRKVFK